MKETVKVRLWCDICQEWDGHRTENCEHARRERRTRGSSNKDVRGNSRDRARRKVWVMATYRSNVTWIRLMLSTGSLLLKPEPEQYDAWMGMLAANQVEPVPTCRCYRCGILLTFDTLTVDKIFPQIDGGKYNTPRMDKADKKTNVRPACYDCNTSTGARLASRLRIPKKARA